MKRILLLFLWIELLSCAPSNAEITVLSDLTLYDDATDLVWVDHALNSLTWADATTYAAAFEDEFSADWRLPTRTELLALVDETQMPMISPLFSFSSTSQWAVWSSTETTDASHSLSDRAYSVYFADGSSFSVPKLSRRSFLLVRAYGDYEGALIDSADAYLLDSAGNYLLGDV